MINANEYGKALFMLAEETGREEKISKDIETVKAVFKSNEQYVKLLDIPALPKEEKLMLIDRAFKSVDEYLVNFLKMLCENHSVYAFEKTAESYFAYYDEARGIERAEAITVFPLTETQKKQITLKLEQITGKQIILKNTLSPEIIGGIKIRYAGKQLDGSIKTRLDALEKNLKTVIV